MKKFASFPKYLLPMLLTVAVPLLVSNCMETTQTSQSAVAGQSASAPSLAGGETAMTGTVQTNMTVGERPPLASALARADASTDDYRISGRDILQVAVFQVKDLNSTVQVGEDGNITLPLVGKIHVRGKTTPEAEQVIADKLREKYLQSPQVSVSVKQYGKRITVSGEVKSPHVLPDDGNTTLSQAVAGSGGLTELADAARVHVARSSDQRVQDDVYNLDDIQAGKTKDPLLKGGDIVVVETSGSRVALKSVKDLLPFAILATLF